MSEGLDYAIKNFLELMPSCVNCEHFSQSSWQDPNKQEKEEYCTLDKQKRRAPAKVIARGCPAFKLDVPF